MELAFCGLALLLLALDPGADATARPLPRVIVEDGALTLKPARGSAWQAESRSDGRGGRARSCTMTDSPSMRSAAVPTVRRWRGARATPIWCRHWPAGCQMPAHSPAASRAPAALRPWLSGRRPRECVGRARRAQIRPGATQKPSSASTLPTRIAAISVGNLASTSRRPAGLSR